jgi:hypothetical protein
MAGKNLQIDRVYCTASLSDLEVESNYRRGCHPRDAPEAFWTKTQMRCREVWYPAGTGSCDSLDDILALYGLASSSTSGSDARSLR